MENNRKKILAIDDNSDNLITVTALLRDIFPDIEVVTALSGRKGIECARQTGPDVILLDILMPGMDGFEVCREIKADLDLREIPVVFLTALKADRQNRICALQAGADGFLNKPIDESELAAQIQAMLRIRAANVKVNNDIQLLAKLVEERTDTLEKELAERIKTERELRFVTRRLNAFWEITRLQDSSLTALCDHLLASIVAMTESEYGFYGFVNEDETAMTIYSWSGEAMAGCGMVDKPTAFPINDAGVWGEAVRKRAPFVLNDYAATHPAKKGLPVGHVPLKRLLVIPVFSGNRIVSVAAVANRAYDYQSDDIQQIMAFVENMQLIIDRKRIETALEASEERYRRIAEGITDYIYSVTISEGKAVYTVHSIACEKITGYTAKEFEDDPYLWITMVPEDERSMVLQRGKDIISGKQVTPIEHHILRKDGELRWVSDNAILNKNEQGKVFSYDGVIKDITESKMIAEAQTFLLHSGHQGSSQTFFELLAEYLAVSLKMDYVCIDRLEGDGLTASTVAVYNNGSFDPNTSYALKDTPCGEVVGKQICCFPDDVCLLFPKDAALKALKAESYIGTTLWSFDGKPIGLIAVIGKKPLKNPDSTEKVIKLVAIRAAGELERQLSDDKLKISISKFRTIFEQAPLGIGLSDTETGEIYEINNRFAEILGRPRDTLFALDWMSITHPDDLAADLSHFTELKEGKIPGFSMQKRYLKPDGSYVSTKMTVARVASEENGMQHHLCMIEDITEIQKFEARLRQSEKMEAIGTLAGGIAHDFNNVLGGIIGFTGIALNNAEPGSALEKHLTKILKASDRAKHLVKQILTFSRQSELKKEVTSLYPVIQESLDLLKASMPSSIYISADLSPDAHPILADSTQIHEMILNIVTNAMHAMKNKGTLYIKLFSSNIVEIKYGLIGTLQPGNYTIIEIGDDGCGMDEPTLKKAFEPFFTTKPVGEGTGMGLAVVRGVVQSHGGDLDVESEPGKGTLFRIYFPTAHGTPELAEDCGVDKNTTGTERIVFVDDEDFIVDIARERFEGLGYSVVAFTDSTEAYRYICANSTIIDLLVTDQTMPGMTGFELAQAALHLRSDLPVILCTGYSRDVNLETALTAGISRMLMKPCFGANNLESAVREVLDHAKKRSLQSA